MINNAKLEFSQVFVVNKLTNNTNILSPFDKRWVNAAEEYGAAKAGRKTKWIRRYDLLSAYISLEKLTKTDPGYFLSR